MIIKLKKFISANEKYRLSYYKKESNIIYKNYNEDCVIAYFSFSPHNIIILIKQKKTFMIIQKTSRYIDIVPKQNEEYMYDNYLKSKATIVDEQKFKEFELLMLVKKI